MMIKIIISQVYLIIMKNTIISFEFLPSNPWKQKELLSEEFKSLGFYISNHPLNEYKEIFNQLGIISYDEFYKMMKMKV